MLKLNPILPPLALLLSLCLFTACVTTPLHRFPLEVRNLGNEEIRDIQVRCGLANCITKKFLGAPATSPNPENTWASIQLPLPLPGSLEVSWHSKLGTAYHQVLPLPTVFPKRAGHVVAIEIASPSPQGASPTNIVATLVVCCEGVATLNVDAVASVAKGFP
jgi:hypothetical protein